MRSTLSARSRVGTERERAAGRGSAHKDAIERRLREDPTRKDGEVAREFGVGVKVISRARERLEISQSLTQLEQDAKALREVSKPVTAEQFGALVGVERARGGKRLRKLVTAGLASVEVVRPDAEK